MAMVRGVIHRNLSALKHKKEGQEMWPDPKGTGPQNEDFHENWLPCPFPEPPVWLFASLFFLKHLHSVFPGLPPTDCRDTL